MKFRRIALWALIDMLGTSLGVALMSVNPVHAKTDGIKPPAQFLISADWPISDVSDIDLWVVGPTRKPVFYGSRQVGCADLDHDDVGSSSRITLADDSVVMAVAHKEVATLRCIEPGHYDIAVNEFTDNTRGRIPVHVEITGLNPSVRTLFSGDVTLGHTGQTANIVSFDLDREGKLTLAQPPLESVLDAYEKTK